MEEKQILVKIRDQRGIGEKLPEEVKAREGIELGEFMENLPLPGGPGYYTILHNGKIAERGKKLETGDEIGILPLSVGG